MTCGYCNRLLRVDLTTRRVSVTPLPEEATLRRYVGGPGLGLKILLDETRPGQSAADPTSPLIMLTGPLAGTSAPSSSTLTVVSLNYAFPYAADAGRSHGHLAAFLKHAGYDGIVVTGRSEKPVFLWVDDKNVEIRDAETYWGLDTRETERLIKRSLHDESSISVACIGPAGEARLPGSGITNDRNHGTYEASVGAAMGAKRLKAIAVRGTGRVPLKFSARFEKVSRQWADAILANGQPTSCAPLYQGKNECLHSHDPRGAEHRERSNLSPNWAARFSKRLASTAVTSWTVLPRASYNCKIACAYDCHINEGEFAGFSASLRGSSETLSSVAALFGIEDPAAAIVLADYFDALGIDSCIGGLLIGIAFELYNEGVLTVQDTDGLELTWGNVDAARELLSQVIEGRGFGGRVLAKGLTEAARFHQTAARARAVHGDDDRLTTSDWRDLSALLMSQVFNTPIAHASGATLDPGQDAREPLKETNTANAVIKTKTRLWEDSLGVCGFACRGVSGVLDYSTRALQHATGWADFGPEEALLVGERIAVLQQLLAIRCDEPSVGDFDGFGQAGFSSSNKTFDAVQSRFNSMTRMYYQSMDWDTNTGRPTEEALARVGLKNLTWLERGGSGAKRGVGSSPEIQGGRM